MKSSIVLYPTVALLSIAAFGQRFEGGFDRTLQVSGPVELDAETDSGGIVVRQGSAGSVQVHVILRSNDRWQGGGDVEQRIRALEANPPVEQSGNVIRVGHVRDKQMLRGISMRLEITVPRTTRVRAVADSGGVTVSAVDGPVDCQTDSGGIEVSSVNADVNASADSGGIRISDVRGKVVAQVDSGGIQATNVAGSLDLSTDSGGVRIAQTTPAPIKVRADSGGAHIKLAPSGGYDIDAGSDSGRVTTPEIAVQGALSKRHVQGRVRGGGPLVDVRVDSGNVTIE
jgi:Putative adhesin